MDRATGVLGFAAMIGIAWLMSSDRHRVNWRLVGMGVALQVVFGLIVLKTELGRGFFRVVNAVFLQLLAFTEHGARFIFGNLTRNNVPVGTVDGAAADMAPLQQIELWANTGAFFAFSILPVIIFFSALTSVLYYLGILQRVVRGIAWLMHRTMRTSGAETLSVAANIFVGLTEAPLLVKPYIKGMTPSELNTLMVGGFATIAGSVMAAYIGMLSPFFPDVGGHLLTASVMNAPAALLLSKILLPETLVPETAGTLRVASEKHGANVIDAAASGAGQGLQLALNVGAMLLAFVALLAMINFGIAWMGGLVGVDALSLERILGWLLTPLAWLMGVPWDEAAAVGSLVGIKVVLTEFVGYLQLAGALEQGVLSAKSELIATYALLGFANLPTIAILIGGVGGLAPERRPDLARLGLRAMVAGNLAAFMSASLAGVLV